MLKSRPSTARSRKPAAAPPTTWPWKAISRNIWTTSIRSRRFRVKRSTMSARFWWSAPASADFCCGYSCLPLLDETGYVPSMKFASGFEILEHCRRMAQQFGFYDHCLFHTTVEGTTWDEASGRWIVQTDRGDKMRARFVILANGILTTPKLARIPGMEK